MQNKKRSTSALKTLKRILSIILKNYFTFSPAVAIKPAGESF